MEHPANHDSYIRAKQIMQCSMFYVAEFSAAVQHPVPHSVQRVQSQRQPPPEPALAAPGLQQVLHHIRRPAWEVGEQFLLCTFMHLLKEKVVDFFSLSNRWVSSVHTAPAQMLVGKGLNFSAKLSTL